MKARLNTDVVTISAKQASLEKAITSKLNKLLFLCNIIFKKSRLFSG